MNANTYYTGELGIIQYFERVSHELLMRNYTMRSFHSYPVQRPILKLLRAFGSFRNDRRDNAAIVYRSKRGSRRVA